MDGRSFAPLLTGGTYAPRPPVELCDLERDPWEQDNLADRAECAGVERQLAGMLDRWMADTRDPILREPVLRPPAEAELVARIRTPEAMQRRRDNEAAIQREYMRLRDGA